MITADQVGPPGSQYANDVWVDPAPPEEVEHDFDADWAARGMTGRPVRILGGIYLLPAEPPAKLILQKARMQREPGRKVELSEVVDLLATVVGKTNVDAWIEKGIGFAKLTDIMQYCMRQMGRTAGKLPAPTEGATPGSTGFGSSSSIGGSSVPTGDASTTPTSWTNSTPASPGPSSAPTWPA